MSEHLCATCSLAVWNRRAGGNLHPAGDGQCNWTPPHIPTPATWHWGVSWSSAALRSQPHAEGGYIVRKLGRHDKPVTKCETYARKP